jgi:hypothetical protein
MFWPFSELILTVSSEKYINALEHQDYCYIKELCLVRTSFILVYSSVYTVTFVKFVHSCLVSL